MIAIAVQFGLTFLQIPEPNLNRKLSR